MATTTGFDFDATYTVAGYRGIAWYAWRYATERVPSVVFGADDQEMEVAEWEEEEDRSRVVCTMVGDDRKFTFDVDELTPIAREDYCAECGQVGCKADGYDRTEASE